MRTVVFATLLAWALTGVTTRKAGPPVDLSGTWTVDLSRSRTTDRSTPQGQSGVRAPNKVREVPPVFPADALQAKIAGRVLLEGLIDRAGHIADLRVLKSIPKLDDAAVAAVWQWEYTPAMRDGKPEEMLVSVLVSFDVTGGVYESGTPVSVPFKAFGSGLGLGRVPLGVSIVQDDKKVVVTSEFRGQSYKMTYSPDAKAVVNKLKNYGSARDNNYSYTSHWDAGRLVTDIAWSGPHGLRTAGEVITRDGDTLTITTSRPDPMSGGAAFTQTLVYTRRQ